MTELKLSQPMLSLQEKFLKDLDREIWLPERDLTSDTAVAIVLLSFTQDDLITIANKNAVTVSHVVVLVWLLTLYAMKEGVNAGINTGMQIAKYEELLVFEQLIAVESIKKVFADDLPLVTDDMVADYTRMR